MPYLTDDEYENLYSEEEVLNLIEKAFNEAFIIAICDEPYDVNITKWFENNK